MARMAVTSHVNVEGLQPGMCADALRWRPRDVPAIGAAVRVAKE
jgi:hypothetical protein